MRRYNKNVILVSIIISITLLCVYSFNLGNYNLNRRELNQRTDLKLSQIEEISLTLNTEKTHQSIGLAAKRYFITVPKGNIHIKVWWDSFWDMDLELHVYSDDFFGNLIATSDNPGNEQEFIDLYIEQEMTIYITVYYHNQAGFFNIIVHDDSYISPQTISTIIVIIIIVGVIVGVSGFIVKLKKYTKKRKEEIETFITAELKPYPAKMEESFQPKNGEDVETNIFICPYCGQENLKSYKKCKYCKKKFKPI